MDTSWQLYVRTEDAWQAMLNDCAKATRSIDLEQYIFLNDDIGKKFIDVFLRKAREGVKVRMLIDAAGSFSVYLSNLQKELKSKGIELLFFNPFPTWVISNTTSWFFRDHRKILVVDQSVAHTGGVCGQENMATWRDTHVRVEGPLVKLMAEGFERMWEGSLWKEFFHFRAKRPQILPDGFGFYTNSPHYGQRYFYWSLLDAIRGARKYIYLTSPYFIPDRRMFTALRLAAQRGGDVRILTVHKSDHNFIDFASSYYISPATRRGIRYYRYSASMLHAKSTVIDGRWATVGSSNIDNWSFVYNYEANIVGTAPKFVEEIKNMFLSDLTDAKEVNYAEWHRRPWLRKVLEKLARPLHRFM